MVGHFSGIWVLVSVVEFNRCLGFVGRVKSIVGLGCWVGIGGGLFWWLLGWDWWW